MVRTVASEFEKVFSADVTVRGFLHLPDAPSGDALVLTHGAGADCRSELLVTLAAAFCASGVTVLRYDLPFRQSRPHGPPPRGSAERDQQGLRWAAESMRQEITGRVFLGGHSYGGRQASILAASAPGLIDGLLLLSYPLHPPKRRDQLRTGHFPRLQTAALFVQGTRDGFATGEELSSAVALIPARAEILTVPQAGHELLTPRNRTELPEAIVAAFRNFFR